MSTQFASCAPAGGRPSLVSSAGWFRVFLLLVAMGALMLAQAGCTRSAKISRHLGKGDRYFAAGEFPKAEIEYANVLQLDSKNPVAIAKMALIFSYEGRLGLASSFLPNARKLQPDNLDVRLRLALFNLNVNRLAEAREDAFYVIERRPDDDDVAFILTDTARQPKDAAAIRQRLAQLPSAGGLAALITDGLFDLRDRKFDEAEAKFAAAQKLAPKSSSPVYARALLLVARQDNPGAENAYSKAADAAPLWSTQRIRYAQFLLAQKKPAEAKRYLTELTNQAPYVLPAWMQLATIAAIEKRYDEELGYLGKVIAQDPVHHDALLAQARATYDKGDKAKAVALLERMAKLFPKSPEPNLQLGLYHWAMGDAEPAVTCLNQVLALAPNTPAAILLLAEIDIRRGRAAPAVKVLQDLVQKQPALPAARLLLAQAYQAVGNLDAALAVYRQLEVDFAPNPQTQYLMGGVLFQQNKPVAARQAFDQVLRLSPRFYPALEQLVNIDLLEKRFAAAKGRIKAWQIEQPKSAALQLLTAKVHLAAGETPEAETALLKVIEYQPESPLGYFLLGELYLQTRQTQKALERLQQSVAKNKNNVQALMLIASLQEQQGNFTEARKGYEDALALNPKLPAALNNLALLYSDKFNDVEKGFQLAQRARELLPQDPSVADTLGWIAFQKRQYVWALDLFTQSVEKLTGNAEAHYHLGMTQYMLGRREAARPTLERAITLNPSFPGAADARDALAVLALDPNATGAEAQRILQAQLAKHPDDAAALTQLGAIYEHTAALDKARTLYESALKATPNNAAAALGLIRIHTARRDSAAALEVATTLHKLAPENADITHELGRLVFASGNQTWALSLLQDAARRQPNDPDVQFDLALAAYSKGRVAETTAALEAALQATVPFARAPEARALAEMIEFAADPEKATAATDQIQSRLKTQPNDVPALMALGTVKMQKGEWDGAEATYEKVLAQYADFTPAHRGLVIASSHRPTNNPKAVAVAVKARTAYANDAELGKAFGVLMYRGGDYSRSASALQECARRENVDAETLYYLGLAQSQLKDKPASDRSLRRALELGLNGPQAAEAEKLLARKTK